MQSLDDADRECVAWLAGFLEGEGCFYLRVDRRVDPPRHYAGVAVGTTDEDVARRAAALMGVEATGPYSNGRDGWKPIYKIQVQASEDARELMRAIQPRMGERRRAKIQEVLDATG